MAIIDVSALLGEISPDSPAGENLEYETVFGEMERAAEGKPEQQFGNTIISAEEPDWKTVKAKSLEVLSQSKDIRAAVHLVRALAHTDQLAGLADGLELLSGLIERYWENLHPELDPEDELDPTIRINALLNLCEPLAFLPALSKIPLVQSQMLGRFSLRDIQIAEGTIAAGEQDNPKIALDQLDAAFKDSPADAIQARIEQIRRARQSIKTLDSSLAERIRPDQAPDLQPLDNLLLLMETEITKRGDSGQPETADTIAGEFSPNQNTGVANQAIGSIQSRSDVVNALDQICRYYEQREPSSPVPLLLKRAKHLVKKDFYEIVQDLAPGGMSQFSFLWSEEQKAK